MRRLTVMGSARSLALGSADVAVLSHDEAGSPARCVWTMVALVTTHAGLVMAAASEASGRTRATRHSPAKVTPKVNAVVGSCCWVIALVAIAARGAESTAARGRAGLNNIFA